MKILSLIIASLLNTAVMASEEPSQLDRINQFLESNVMGRTLLTKAKGTNVVDGQNLLIDFESKTNWSNLAKTEEGIVYQERRDVKQTNTKLDAKGNPIGKPVSNDRIVTRRIAVSERKTTNSLVGVTTTLENTGDMSFGDAFETMIEISSDNKELYVYESLVGFVERSFFRLLRSPNNFVQQTNRMVRI